MQDKKLKIVHYIHSLTNGGAETVVKDYVIALKKMGYDVSVVVDYEYPEMITHQQVKAAGVDIISIYGEYKNTNIIKKIWNKISRLLFNKNKKEKFLKKFLQNNTIDVLHCHSNVEPFNNFIDILKEKNTKFFCTCHTDLNRLISIIPSFYNSAMEFVSKYEINFIALHEDMAKDINEKFGVNNTVVLNNPINLERFKAPQKTKLEIKKELNIPQDAFVLGHVGRFHPVKNHDFLVEVFSEVKKINPKAFLLMVGSGETKQDIQAKLHTLNLKDWLILENRSDIPDILQAMDCFVFPSIKEGFPIVLLEAQANNNLKIYCSSTVSSEVCVTNNICMLNLDDGGLEWAKTITGEFTPATKMGNLESFDLNNVINELLKIYTNHN